MVWCWLVMPGCFLVETSDAHSDPGAQDAAREVFTAIVDGGSDLPPDTLPPVDSSVTLPKLPAHEEAEPPELIPTTLPGDVTVVLAAGGGITLPVDGGRDAGTDTAVYYDFAPVDCPYSDTVEFDELHWDAALPAGTAIQFELVCGDSPCTGLPVLTLSASTPCDEALPCGPGSRCTAAGVGATCVSGASQTCVDDADCRASGNSQCVSNHCAQPASPAILDGAFGWLPVTLRASFSRNSRGEAATLRSLRVTYFCHVSI